MTKVTKYLVVPAEISVDMFPSRIEAIVKNGGWDEINKAEEGFPVIRWDKAKPYMAFIGEGDKQISARPPDSNKILIEEMDLDHPTWADKDMLAKVISDIDAYSHLSDELMTKQLQENDKLVFDDDDEAVEYADELEKAIDIRDLDGNGSDFFKSQCIDGIQELVKRHGWDFLYNLVEPHLIMSPVNA